ncbi:MAG: hypothetical protein QME96_06270 [Myxococcota bacterium]|nr:hypothetical protein [Myxococcota bacterium]
MTPASRLDRLAIVHSLVCRLEAAGMHVSDVTYPYRDVEPCRIHLSCTGPEGVVAAAVLLGLPREEAETRVSSHESEGTTRTTHSSLSLGPVELSGCQLCRVETPPSAEVAA